MKNKIVLTALLVVILVAGVVSIYDDASAQSSLFPTGCASALGYSAISGLPCNGTRTATANPMLGCTTALGYSVTTGKPCSGSSFALNYLAGCTSINGYSSFSGQACNGTTVATNGFTALYPGIYLSPLGL